MDSSKINSKTCPHCGEKSQEKFRPFCSAHCREQDLGKWALGDYKIAGEDVYIEDEARDSLKIQRDD